jgi:hypothetical protein
MAKTGANEYIFVMDKKFGDPDGTRLARLQVTDKGIEVSNIEIENLERLTEPNDLESICSVPTGQEQYIVAESGYKSGRFGRVFRIQVFESNGIPKARILSFFSPIPANDAWPDLSTPSAYQVEGLACIIDREKNLWLLLGTRGSKDVPARIIWGEISGWDAQSPTFSRKGEQSLDENPLGDRAISEIYLEKLEAETWRMWASATVDQGDDGPFRSIIYSPGVLHSDSHLGLYFEKARHHASWIIEGLKVEGLAGPPDLLPGAAFAIGSDDEHYFGIWRPLSKQK